MPSKLDSCVNCTGFVPAHVSACPNCGQARGTVMSRLRLLAGALGGGAVAFTLMACYGAPCANGQCGGPRYEGDGSAEEEEDDDAGRDAAKPDVQVVEDAGDGGG